MQTQFKPSAKAPTRLNRHPTSAQIAISFPKDRPLGFTRHELRHMVAEMIG
jgi:hypothetical protein